MQLKVTGEGVVLSSGSSNILFIQNTKGSGCFNQTHSGSRCSSSVILKILSEALLHYFLTGASALNPSNMVDYDPGRNLASSDSCPAPQMVNGAARWRRYLQQNREVLLQRMLTINRPRWGAASCFCRGPWQMVARRVKACVALVSHMVALCGDSRCQLRRLQVRTERKLETDSQNNV